MLITEKRNHSKVLFSEIKMGECLDASIKVIPVNVEFTIIK